MKPPKGLSAASRSWWTATVETFELEPHHLRHLQIAVQSWDRMQEARARIKADGPYLLDRFGQLKPHPGHAVERDQSVIYMRAMRELDLDAEGPAEAFSRPPAIASNRG